MSMIKSVMVSRCQLPQSNTGATQSQPEFSFDFLKKLTSWLVKCTRGGERPKMAKRMLEKDGIGGRGRLVPPS